MYKRKKSFSSYLSVLEIFYSIHSSLPFILYAHICILLYIRIFFLHLFLFLLFMIRTKHDIPTHSHSFNVLYASFFRMKTQVSYKYTHANIIVEIFSRDLQCRYLASKCKHSVEKKTKKKQKIRKEQYIIITIILRVISSLSKLQSWNRNFGSLSLSSSVSIILYALFSIAPYIALYFFFYNFCSSYCLCLLSFFLNGIGLFFIVCVVYDVYEYEYIIYRKHF